MTAFLALVACAAPGSPGPEFVVTGARAPGGAPLAFRVRDGVLVEVGAAVEVGGWPEVKLGGRFVAPAFVDSHVHLTYLPLAREMVDGGVVAVVDLAAPLDRLVREVGGPRLSFSGPMLTAPGGYPTTSWGADGYGLEVADERAARRAVRQVVDAGAVVVKVPFEAPTSSDEVLAAIVDEAHSRGVPVVAHALGDAEAARAAALGIDGLAHTPVERLSPETVRAWSGRFVVSTLGAFGGSADAVANLRELRAAGATVLYGTDFGNTRTPGIDPRELELLAAAGLDGAAILAAGTSTPAARWGLLDLGALEVGRAASFLVLDADPFADPASLGRPEEVWSEGSRR